MKRAWVILSSGQKDQFVYTLSGTIPMEELEKVAEGIQIDR